MLTIAAYCDTWSAAPGETVGVKVGSYGARRYRAELRRVIQGDRNPAGPGESFEVVVADLCGEREAVVQPIRPGSSIVIPDRGGTLADLRSFTLAIPVQPTRLPADSATIATLAGAGASLRIDADGRPVLDIGATTVHLPVAIEQHSWTVLVAACDAGRSEIRLAALDPAGRTLSSASATLRGPWTGAGATELRFASAAPGAGCFDGKLDSPALFSTALAPLEAFARLSRPADLGRAPDLVGFWDFTRSIATTRIEDASPHHLDGATVQCPARAMTGWRWTGESRDWTQRPDLYSAIHFHSDDMTDAGWSTSFTVTLPDDLRSGIYSVHLVPDGDEPDAFDCVFVVRPPRERASGNTICLLLPTASYLAYANHRLGLDVAGTEIGMGRLVEIDRHHAFLQEHPELGFSFYETHGDGSGVFHSSRNRPVVDFQPSVRGFLGGLGSNLWQLAADTHITGWLEAAGVGYDVITDEDLDRDGLALLRRYRVVVTGSHPEYHSTRMLDAIEGFLGRGGRLMYLGGNGFYWRISFSDHHPGVIECRRSEAGIRPWEPGIGQFHHAFTGEYGGLWRRNGRSSGTLCGLVMSSQGFDVSEPYDLTEAASDPRASFIFKGVDASAGRPFGAFGLAGNGAAGMEIDRADPALGTPAHALVLGSSRRHTDIYLMTPEDLLDPTPDMTGTQSEAVRADMVFFETPSGGAVFSAGSIAWPAAMASNGYDNEVAKVTLNVLGRFDDAAPFDPPGRSG
jgi:N,N-dimethylformamidase